MTFTSAESLVHHLSLHTNGTNGAVEGFRALKYVCAENVLCILLDLRTTETFVLFQKHIADKVSVWLFLKGPKYQEENIFLLKYV